MSFWSLLAEQVKHWIKQEFFYIKHKIKKPKEVVVIKGKFPPEPPDLSQ